MSNGIRSLIKTDKAAEHFETAKREVPYIVTIAMKFKYIRRNQSVPAQEVFHSAAVEGCLATSVLNCSRNESVTQFLI